MLHLEMSELKESVRESACPQSLGSEVETEVETYKNILESVTSEIQDTWSGWTRRSIHPVSFGLVTFNLTVTQFSLL